MPVAFCASGAVVNNEAPGNGWITVGTLFYPKSWPGVFGVEYRVGDLEPPWGVRVHLNLRGRTVTGSSFAFQFLGYENGAVAHRLEVPDTWSYRVDQTTFSVPLAGFPSSEDEAEARALAVEAEIGRLCASPASFKDTVLQRIEDLEREVERGLDAHEARKCEYGEYKGGGVPPACTLVPLTMEEEVLWASRVRQELEQMRALVRAHGAALHARLQALLPPELWS